MPVEPHDFDVLIATPAAGEEAGTSDVVVSTPDLSRHDDEEDQQCLHTGVLDLCLALRDLRQRRHVVHQRLPDADEKAVSYTRMTRPTIYSV